MNFNPSIFFILFLTLQLPSCEIEKKEINLDKLIMVDSIWVCKETKQPYSGKYVEYFSDGNIKGKGEIKKGISHGMFEKYYTNGQKESFGFVVNGKPDGLYETWYENGNKASEIKYKNGILHEKSQEWYPNGQVSSEAVFFKGELDGYSIKFFENGKPNGYSYYTKGKLDSLFLFYEDGSKKAIIKYLGKEDNYLQQEWDENGNFIFNYKMIDGEVIDLN